MTHPDEETLLEYASDRIEERNRLEVEEHVGVCDPCLNRVRALLYLRSRFDNIWPSWTAAEHARLCRQWKLALALQKVAETVPAVANRAREWLDRLDAASTRMLKVIVDKAKRVASQGVGALPPEHGFRLQPAVAGVGAADREAEGCLQKASALLSEGRAEQALQELESAASIDPRLPQATRSIVEKDGTQRAEIVVDSRRARAAVKLWATPGEPPPSIAILLPQNDPEQVAVGEFEEIEGEEYMLAEFTQIPGGELELYW